MSDLVQHKTDNRHATLEDDIQPGSYWRITNADHEVAEMSWSDKAVQPAHGVLLLLKEVRIIDGDIHTLVLGAHPGWVRSDDVKMLLETFLRVMTLAPDGASLRDSEVAQVMQQVSEISADIATPPADHHFTKLLTAQEKPDVPEPKVGLLPAALLPGRDANEAETLLNRNIAVMQARSDWVSSRMDDMNAHMKLVNRFQTERVSATMAGISEQIGKAQKMLKGVHTMRLFLGEGIETFPLTKGSQAPVDTPLHLMQRLLYLDEEIFVDSVMRKGFCADDMGDLSQILTANPELVNRMLPHPRCVAITRIRRNDRQIGEITSMSQAMIAIENMKADAMIQILIRDGGNVWMVTADEETSGAKRLFPSNAEIDRIFTVRGNSWRDGDRRSVTARDIEYSDVRKDHDKTALLYKRFLIILWGLSERENIFGDFIAAGENWFDKMRDESLFRFVHDEEGVLGDGRVDIMSYISTMNTWLRAKSQVVMQGVGCFTSEQTPKAFKHSQMRSYEMDRVRSFVQDYHVAQVLRRGEALVAQYPSQVMHYSGSKPVINTDVHVGQTRFGSSVANIDGVLCLDKVTSADLTYYIESRNHRQNYQDWLGMFLTALPLVQSRDLAMARIVAFNVELLGEDCAASARLAAEMTCEALALPICADDIDLPKTVSLTKSLMSASETDFDPALQIRVAPNGQVSALNEVSGMRIGDLWFPVLQHSNLTSSGSFSATKPKITVIDPRPDIGTHVLHDSGAMPGQPFGTYHVAAIANPEDFKACLSLFEAPTMGDAAAHIIDQATGPTDIDWLEMMFESMRRLVQESKSKLVFFPHARVDIGFVASPNEGDDSRGTLRRISIDVDLMQLAIDRDRQDLNATFCSRIFENKASGEERAAAYVKNGNPAMTFAASVEKETGAVSKLQDKVYLHHGHNGFGAAEAGLLGIGEKSDTDTGWLASNIAECVLRDSVLRRRNIFPENSVNDVISRAARSTVFMDGHSRAFLSGLIERTHANITRTRAGHVTSRSAHTEESS